MSNLAHIHHSDFSTNRQSKVVIYFHQFLNYEQCKSKSQNL